MEIRKVAFPVDLAGSSYRIAPQVRYLVDKFNAELHLVYVVESLEKYCTFFIPHLPVDQMETEGMALAEKHLGEFAEKHFPGVPKVKVSVLCGNVVEQIEKYIDSEGIDTAVVATHDRGIFERAIFGDVSEKLVRTLHVPVTVIHPFARGERHDLAETMRPDAEASRMQASTGGDRSGPKGRGPAWQDMINVLLGLWLAASPWLLMTYSRETGVMIANCIISGLLIAGFSLWAAVSKHETWQEQVVVLLCLWLFIAPASLRYMVPPITWNSVYVGMAAGMLALWSLGWREKRY